MSFPEQKGAELARGGKQGKGPEAPPGVVAEQDTKTPDQSAVDALFDDPEFVAWLARVGGEEAERLSGSGNVRDHIRLVELGKTFAVKQEAIEGLRGLWKSELSRFFGVSPEQREIEAITASVAETLDRWAFERPDMVRFLKREIDELAVSRERVTAQEKELAQASAELEKLEKELVEARASRSGLVSEWGKYKRGLISFDGPRKLLCFWDKDSVLRTGLEHRQAIQSEAEKIRRLEIRGMRQGIDFSNARRALEETGRHLSTLTGELLSASLVAPQVRMVIEDLAVRRMQELFADARTLADLDAAREYQEKTWSQLGARLFGKELEMSAWFHTMGAQFAESIRVQIERFAASEIRTSVARLPSPTLSGLEAALAGFLAREDIGGRSGPEEVRTFVLETVDSLVAELPAYDPRRILARRLSAKLAPEREELRVTEGSARKTAA